MRITVTTPTGNIGSKLAGLLLGRGAEITVIARHPEKVDFLAQRGAQVIPGDMEDAAVIGEAIQGSDALFWVTPPNFASRDPLGYARRLADTAASVVQNVPNLNVVQISSVGAHLVSGTGPIAGLHATEERFRVASKNFVALRPNFFMENIFGSLRTIITDGKLFTSVPGSVAPPQIATKDIATVAADVLLSPIAGQRVIDIAGPQDVSFDQAVEIAGKAVGKPIQVVTVPAEKLRSGLEQAGLSPAMASLYLEMEDAMAHGLSQDFRGDEKRIGTITYQQFVNESFVPMYKKMSAAVA